MRPRSTHYRRGTVLWHGTNAGVGFRELRGPAWVSDSRAVARTFATSYTNRDGELSRVTKYVVDVPFSLPTYDAHGGSTISFEEWLAWLTNEPDLDLSSGSNEIAETVCARGLDGWRIIDNYMPGDDIMICRPERFLRRVSTGGAWRP